MLHLEINTDAVDKKLAEMQANLRQAAREIPEELFNWQAEDLHRKAPWIRRVGRRRAWQTIIRPHSIKEMQRSRAARIRAHRRRTEIRHWSTRPILREELLKDLYDRMTTLMSTIFKW